MIPLMRFGITTGLATAAAAKAAALFALGERPRAVMAPAPTGLRTEVSVERLYVERRRAEVKKFSGDDPDVLNGALIRACVKLGGKNAVTKGGRGVGGEHMTAKAEQALSNDVAVVVFTRGGELLARV